MSYPSILNACILRQDTVAAAKESIFREQESMMSKYSKSVEKHLKEHGLEPEFEVIVKSEKLRSYEELYRSLTAMDVEARKSLEEMTRCLFLEKLETWKTPNVTFSPIPLDCRTCKVSDVADELKEFDYILEVTVAKGLDSGGRIAIPFKTSKHCLLRMEKFENCQPSICIDKTGKVKLSLPIKKKVEVPDAKHGKTVIGTDLGILKIFSLANGMKIGSFKGKTSEYSQMVENKLGERSTLRNTMRKYQKELKSKNISDERREILRSKIFNIAKNLQGHKRLTKARNRYKFSVNKSISAAVKEFMRYLIPMKSKVLVVLENLDINEFECSAEANKRNSMWTRGQIVDKFIKALDWHGIPYDFVDPAYTSQQCPICSHVDKANRKGEAFKYTCCGHEDDADNNAGVNIGNRYGDVEIAEATSSFTWNTKKRHEAIKTILLNRNHTYKPLNKIA